jgi:Alginate export
MKRFVTIMALVAFMCAAPGLSFADINHMDIGGSLDVYAFWSENTIDFNDDGDWMSPDADDQTDFLRLNARLWFTADLSDDVMVKISLEADRAFDSVISGGDATADSVLFASPNTSKTEDLDIFIEEAFMTFSQIYGTCATVKIGRYYMNYGDDAGSEELFNTWWGNSFILGDAQAFAMPDLSIQGTIEADPFDAVAVSFDMDTWLLDVGMAKAAETTYQDEDADLWFAYMQYVGLDNHQIDAYALYTTIDGDLVVGGDDIRIDQYTLGVRVAGDINEQFAYKAELAYNFGDIDYPGSNGDIDGLAGQLGINWHPESDCNGDLGFMYTYLEGDADAGQQADFEGFVAPWENKMYGEIADVLVRTNMHVFNLYGGVDLREDIRLSSGLFYYLLADDDFDTPLLGQFGYFGGGLTDDDDLGWEWDVYLDYQFNEEVTAQLAAGVFLPGDAIEDSYFDWYSEGQSGPIKYGELNDSDEAIFFRGSVKVNF